MRIHPTGEGEPRDLRLAYNELMPQDTRWTLFKYSHRSGGG